jgi:hypothetical protein
VTELASATFSFDLRCLVVKWQKNWYNYRACCIQTGSNKERGKWHPS